MNKKWFAVFAAITALTLGTARVSWAHGSTNQTLTKATHNRTVNKTVTEYKTTVSDHEN